MRDNPYKDLPPLERRTDGSLYRMTPAQRKQAASLIRRECCCCEDGNCIVLDDGDTCTCPQTISFSVCCKWFRWAVLPLDGTLEAEIFRDKDLKRCAVCGGVVDGKEIVMQVKEGQKVIYSKYAGTEVKLDGEEYIIVRQNDILAIVE